MANKLKNTKTGEIYERIDRNSPIFANVDDPREMIELVSAEIADGELIRIDMNGERYSKIA